MERYRNTSGNSGVRHYECGTDYILVQFRPSEEVYRYSYASAGRERVERMKELAQQGHGLASYISRFASDLYEK